MPVMVEGGAEKAVPNVEVLARHPLSRHDDLVCLFCNTAIDVDEEPCRLTIDTDWMSGVAIYWCHGRCLQASVHEEIPLYLLSLLRDEAVYGARSDQ